MIRCATIIIAALIVMNIQPSQADEISDLIRGCQAVDGVAAGGRMDADSSFWAGVCLTLVRDRKDMQENVIWYENTFIRNEKEKLSARDQGTAIATSLMLSDTLGATSCLPGGETVLDEIHKIVSFYHENGSYPNETDSNFVPRALKQIYKCGDSNR